MLRERFVPVMRSKRNLTLHPTLSLSLTLLP